MIRDAEQLTDRCRQTRAGGGCSWRVGRPTTGSTAGGGRRDVPPAAGGGRLRHRARAARADPGRPRAVGHAHRQRPGCGPAVARRTAELRPIHWRPVRRGRLVAALLTPGMGGGDRRRRRRRPRRDRRDRHAHAAARLAVVAAGGRCGDRAGNRARRGCRGAIEHAARTGRQLGVEVAGGTALAQQLLLLFVNGEWAAAADSFEGLASTEDAPPSLLAAFGLACAEAGRLDVVGDVAARLAGEPQLLVRAGMTWGQVAVGATAVAFAAQDTTLAERCGARSSPTAARAWRCLGRGTSAPRIAASGCWPRRSATGNGPSSCWRRRASKNSVGERRSGRREPPPTSSPSECPSIRVSGYRTCRGMTLGWKRTCVRRTGVRYWRGGVQQPVVDVERAGSGALRTTVATGGRRAARRGTPAVTDRRGAGGASRSKPTASSGAPARCPTPSCTATPTSPSSTGRRTPRSWPPRRPASASRPSP